jgi:cytochrome c553
MKPSTCERHLGYMDSCPSKPSRRDGGESRAKTGGVAGSPIARSILLAVVMIAVPTWALGDSPPGAASCLGCHPATADDGPVPALAKFPAAQIVTALQAYRSGTRPATVMDRIAKGFSDEEIDAIAKWYARANQK